jgi:hypothetical protein
LAHDQRQALRTPIRPLVLVRSRRQRALTPWQVLHQAPCVALPQMPWLLRLWEPDRSYGMNNIIGCFFETVAVEQAQRTLISFLWWLQE